jgi:uncharacterized protein
MSMIREAIQLPVIGAPSNRPAFEPAQLPPGQARRFHVMIKPSGALCNLDCPYCFYLHKAELLGHEKNSRMSDDVLEEHIRQYIESQSGDEVIFSWQGGEPTLMGLEFYAKVVEFQRKYKKPFQRIENDLQTNGVLLTEPWAVFLKQHRFVVGLSIDGPRDLHDKYRFSKGGQPTFDKVMAAARLLKKHKVPFNALCVVNRDNAKRPRDVYRFLTREVGTWRVQFIPCVEAKDFHHTAPQHWDPATLPVVGTPQARPGNDDSIVTDWSVDPDDWGDFLCRVWDDWFSRDFGKVFVNWFETAVAQAMGMDAQQCVTAEFCGKALALEHNGDLFSCDHYVYPEYRLGSIFQTHEGEMVFSEQQQAFGFAKRDTLPQYCRECPHLKLCWGECPKNRMVRTPDGSPGLNYLCPGYKRFFGHIQKQMPDIMRRIGDPTA